MEHQLPGKVISTPVKVKSTVSSLRFIRREKREEIQRFVAGERSKLLRKSVPKVVRERNVHDARTRTFFERVHTNVEPQYEDCYDDDTIQFQGFGGILGLGSAAFNAYTAVQNWRGVQKIADEAVESQQRVTSALEGFIDGVKTAVKGFVERAKKCMSFWWVIPTGILCYLIYREWCSVPIFATALTALFTQLVPESWGVVSHALEEVEEQSGFGLDIASLVATLVCTVLVPFKNVSQLAGEVMKRISSYDRAKDGFKSLFTDAIKYAEKAVNALLGLISDTEVSWTDKTERLLEVWMVKVNEFAKLSCQGNPTIAQLQGAVELQIEGIGFRSVMRTYHSIQQVDKYLQILGLAIQPHKASLDEAGAFRATPVFGCFGGGSAVGKTAMLKCLATAILVLSGECTPEEAIRNLFQKGTTEYWNGYIGQKCYILDDVFQEKPIPGMTDSEYMQIIRAVGNWKYPLNFADLPSKGNFTFTSPLVLGTTNVEDVKMVADSVVNCPEAVVRRIQFGYWVKVAPDWLVLSDDGSKKILDYERLEATFAERRMNLQADASEMDIVACYPWEAWEAYPHKFEGKAQFGTPKPFMNIIKEMSDTLKQRRVQHANAVGGLQDWLNKIGGAVQTQSGFIDAQENFPVEVPSYTSPGATDRIAREFNLSRFHEMMGTRPSASIQTLPSVIPESDTVVRLSDLYSEDDDFMDHIRSNAAHAQSGVGCYECQSMCESDDCDAVNSDILEMRIESRTWITWILSVKYWLWKKACDVTNFAGRSVFTFARFMRGPSSGLYKGLAVAGLVTGLAIVVAIGKSVWSAVKSFVEIAFGEKFVKGPKRSRKKKGDYSSDSDGDSETSEQSNIKDDVRKERAKIPFHRFAEQQAGKAGSGSEKTWIYSGTYKLVVAPSLDTPLEDIKVLGQIQFIQGTIAVFPYHYMKNLEENCKSDERLHFLHPVYDSWEFSMSVAQFLKQRTTKIDGVDMVFMAFSIKGLKAHHNIIPYMLNERQMHNLLKISETKVTLMVADAVKYKRNERLYINRHDHTSPFLEHVGSVCMAGGAVINGVLRYEATTTKGDCGAPLVIHNHNNYGCACYIGFHVAGRSNSFETSGYATYVTQENARAAIAKLGSYHDEFLDDLSSRGVTVTPQSGVELSKLTRGSMLGVGNVSEGLSMAGRTALKVSQLQLDLVFGECPTAPAILRPLRVDDEIISPMVNGLSAYQTPLEVREPRNLDAIVEMATGPLFQTTRDYNRVIMTPEEAVVGLPDMKLRPIARDTSAGYPYRLEVSNGKKDFFGSDGEYTFTSQKWKALETRVLYVVEMAKSNVRLAHVFSDFLKDELRPLHKVESVATRVISGAPLDYVVAVRMYFGAFQSAMFSTRIRNGMSPGINHYSEWGYLAESLLSGGKTKVFGGDFSRFDASEQPYIHVAILDLINRWYRLSPEWSEEDDKVRSILWLDLIHSRHLSGDGSKLNTIVQWNKSLPSGHPLTTMVNSLYSLITLAACYAEATGDLRDMWKHVFLQTFGDDNVNAPDDTVCEVFNQDTVASSMHKLFGLKYTADDKSDVLTKYGDISAVTFLKRRFVRDGESPSGWVGPLLESSFRYIPYWYRNNKDPKGDLIRNIDMMLGELCLHEPEIWARDYALLSDWAQQNKVVLPWTSRDACRQWVFSRTDAWF